MKISGWTRTGESVGFPFTSMPAYTAIPMMPCLVYARPLTITIAFLATMGVWYMTSKGYNMSWLLNRIKGRLCGNRISARPVWFIRRFSHLDDPSKDVVRK